MRASGYARRKHSASMRAAASLTTVAIRLTKFSTAFGPAGRNIERCHETSLMIVNWSGGTTQLRIARIEMLVAVDRQRSLLNETRADAVRALAVLAPDCAGP